MKIESKHLLNELSGNVKNHINRATSFLEVTDEHLNQRHAAKSWSVLECMEHLNLYGDYYIPAIQAAVTHNSQPATETFKSGFLGNYFANSMLPKAKLNKMPTFKNKNPLGSELDKSAIRRFNQQQLELLDLLEQAGDKNLNTIKIPITISRFIRLKLGDTFRFLIYHNERHIQQAERTLSAFKSLKI